MKSQTLFRQSISSQPVIEADFRVCFPKGPVISSTGLHVPADAGISVLFGASGSGKTTLLRCLAGLQHPNEGTLRVGGETWFDSKAGISLPARNRRVGFVPQNYALFPHLSVRDNIGYGLNACPASERRDRVAEAIHWLELDGLELRRPNELSGGQQQRTALARAMVCQPRLLLLDEPLAALDAPTRLRLRGDLKRLLKQLDIPTILVTHDRIEAMGLGDRLIVMDKGRIVQSGPMPEVFNRPESLAAAAIVGVETVQPGTILSQSDGLAKVKVGTAILTGLGQELSFEATKVYVCIRAEDVILTREQETKSSARNRLPASVQRIENEGPMMRLELDCGFALKAILTRQACDELGLAEGEPVFAVIKTPHVHLIEG